MWRRVLLVVVIAGFAITCAAIAEIFSLAADGNAQGHHYSHNQYQPVYASLVQLALRGWHWLRESIDHDTITTIAIAATAIFTGTLYRATNQLRQTSQIHAGH